MRTADCCRMALIGLVLAACRPAVAADEKPVEIKPEDARQHVGETVTVTLKVKSSKFSSKRKTVYLDLEEDFHSERNLGLAISEKGCRDLAEKRDIHDPADHFLNKRIRVVGKIELREGRPYLPIDSAKQIEEIKDPPAKSEPAGP